MARRQMIGAGRQMIGAAADDRALSGARVLGVAWRPHKIAASAEFLKYKKVLGRRWRFLGKLYTCQNVGEVVRRSITGPAFFLEQYC